MGACRREPARDATRGFSSYFSGRQHTCHIWRPDEQRQKATRGWLRSTWRPQIRYPDLMRFLPLCRLCRAPGDPPSILCARWSHLRQRRAFGTELHGARSGRLYLISP